MDSRRVRVVLADDHKVVVEGLSRILEAHFELVATVSNGRELVHAVDEMKPEVVIADISMPHLNGIEAVRILSARSPNTKFIMLTMHTDPEYVRAALHAGVHGYVLKSAASDELVHAVHAVLQGTTYVSEPIAIPPGGANGEVLTSRQREVLQLIAEGFSAKQIASELHISVKTVEFHKTRLLERVGANTTADLIRYAVEHGMTVRN